MFQTFWLTSLFIWHLPPFHSVCWPLRWPLCFLLTAQFAVNTFWFQSVFHFFFLTCYCSRWQRIKDNSESCSRVHPWSLCFPSPSVITCKHAHMGEKIKKKETRFSWKEKKDPKDTLWWFSITKKALKALGFGKTQVTTRFKHSDQHHKNTAFQMFCKTSEKPTIQTLLSHNPTGPLKYRLRQKRHILETGCTCACKSVCHLLWAQHGEGQDFEIEYKRNCPWRRHEIIVWTEEAACGNWWDWAKPQDERFGDGVLRGGGQQPETLRPFVSLGLRVLSHKNIGLILSQQRGGKVQETKEKYFVQSETSSNTHC